MQLAVCHRSTIQVRHRDLTNPNSEGWEACDVTPSSRAQRPKQTHCDSSRKTAGRSIGRTYERCSLDGVPWFVQVKWQVTAVANVAHLLQCNTVHIDTRVFILARRHVCLHLGTMTPVPLSWHIEICAFILTHRNVCLYLDTSTRVSSSWHIDTCGFILAHRHVCLHLGTSTHVVLSWHIETRAFILAHRNMCLYFHFSVQKSVYIKRSNYLHFYYVFSKILHIEYLKNT